MGYNIFEEKVKVACHCPNDVHCGVIAHQHGDQNHKIGTKTRSKRESIKEVDNKVWVLSCPDVQEHI